MFWFIAGILLGVAVTLWLRRGILMLKHQGSIVIMDVGPINESRDEIDGWRQLRGIYPYRVRIYAQASSPEYSKEENMLSLKHFMGLLNDLLANAHEQYPSVFPFDGPGAAFAQSGVLESYKQTSDDQIDGIV